MTRIAVLDYGIGNLRSAEKAFQHVGAEARLTDDPGWIREADGIVLPGVGAFGRCMDALRTSGLDALAIEAIERGTPFIGICIGMQLLFEGSDESRGVAGLGVLPGTSRRLAGDVKVPQMQWNVLERKGAPAMLATVSDPAWAYFVHSYAADTDPSIVAATCDYGGAVVAAVESANVWATQFHPEKSSRIGLAVLRAFVDRASAG